MTDEPKQLGLFGDLPAKPSRKPRGLAPVEVPVDDQAVAEALPPELRMGTSSWSFPGWAGIVYDRESSKATLSRKGLESYSRHPLLRAAGIDRTFYAPVPAEVFAEYAAQVPDDFRFLTKAAAECTTPWIRGEAGRPAGPNPHYLDAQWATEEVVGPYVEGLGEKAGTLLFQFPPQGSRVRRDPVKFAAELSGFLEELPRGPAYTVELRDTELFTADYLAALDAGGAGHCHNVHPKMPAVAEQIAATAKQDWGPFVVRWMLHGGLEYEQALERYEPFSAIVDEDPDTRELLAERCLEQAFAGRQVLIIANNKAEGSAPLTVFELGRAMARRTGPGRVAP